MSRAGTALLAAGVFGAVFAVSWFVLPLAKTSARPEAPQAASTSGPVAGGKVAEGARVSEQRALDLADGDEAMAVVYRIKGIDLPQDLVDSARSDGPPSPTYVRFALIDAGDGRKTSCVSLLGEDNKRVVHGVMRYSATAVEIDETALPPLADYVDSGCAAAVRDHGSLLTMVQYQQKILQLLPKTKAYDDDRRQIIDGIAAARFRSR